MDDLKILLIGPGGVGKTTLRKVFFDQENPFNLLNRTLEPTRGVEVNFYSVGKRIAIHDLAGQELTTWLTSSDQTFYGSDTIILMLDAQFSWDKNLGLINKLQDVTNRACPDSRVYIFFHKIDLLPEDERQDLSNKINDSFNDSNLNVRLTSIAEEFFMKTFGIISNLLKKTMVNLKDVDMNQILLKSEVFSEIQSKGDGIKTSDLLLKFPNSKVKVRNILFSLQNANLIEISNYESISLTEKGQSINEQIKTQIISGVSKKELDLKYIKGLILSERHGRVFYAFEHRFNYFHKMFPDNPNDMDTISSLISMFFGAVIDFTETLDKTGVANINVSGKNTNILLVGYENIFGIFFVEKSSITDSIIGILSKIIKTIHTEANQLIHDFITTGIINDEFREYYKQIEQTLVESDNDIRTVKDVEEDITQEKLFALYQGIANRDFDQIDLKLLKKIIFKHILNSSHSIIDQVLEYGKPGT